MTDDAATPYDEIPYPSVPFVQSHPNRLATTAHLLGMTPAPLPNCRVLELGCAAGENLLPLAIELPDAHFYGIDLSGRQINAGIEAAKQLGISNVELEQLDLLDLREDLGQFDYIIAHGVYSWVPPHVRERLLDICRQHLAPQGVAFVSYNVLPGWHRRGIVRDLLSFHTEHAANRQQRMREALSFLDQFKTLVPDQDPVYKSLITNSVTKTDQPGEENRLYHDFLEEINEPFQFADFISQARSHGLEFLAEADISEMDTSYFQRAFGSLEEKIDGDIVRREQYLDYLKNRVFRQTLLVHDNVRIERPPQAERLAPLWVGTQIPIEKSKDKESGRERLSMRSDTEQTVMLEPGMTQSAIEVLADASPNAVPFDYLQAAARKHLWKTEVVVQSRAEYAIESQLLRQQILQLHLSGMVDLYLQQPIPAKSPGERPLASSWARWQVAQEGIVTNLRHAGIKLDDYRRHLLSLLDGTNTRAQIIAALIAYAIEGRFTIEKDGQVVTEPDLLRSTIAARIEDDLEKAARLALLIA